jgi:pilus assembly protein CpaF
MDGPYIEPAFHRGSQVHLCTNSGFVLKVPLPDVVRMQTRQPNLEGIGEISLRHLVREALRMRPQRIVVGEVRQQECLDLLIALNWGIPGMCTIHANSAREAITKMCTQIHNGGP